MNGNDRLLGALQGLAKQTQDAHEPADYVLGVVVGVNPLSIQIEQNDILPESFLVLTDAVRDYDVDIEVSHTTDNAAGGSGYAEYASHNHGYSGRKKIRVYNSLKVGESVIMLKQAGGQSFVVLSRLENHIGLTGQWG